MTLGDIKTDIYRIVDEVATDNDRVTAADVLAIVNQHYITAARHLRCFRRTVTVSTSNGVFLYPYPAVDILDIETASLNAVPLTKTSLDTIQMFFPNWNTPPTETVRYLYRYDQRQFGLYPAPSGVSQLTAQAVIVPSAVAAADAVPLLSTDADVPKLTSPDHRLLVFGTVADLCSGLLAESEAALAKAQTAKAEYAALLAEAMKEGR